MSETVIRSTRFDLLSPEEVRQPVLQSIRRYRHACREMYGVLVATAAAGAEIIDSDRLSLRPNNDRAAAVLAAAMGRCQVEKTRGPRGAGTVYQLTGAGSAFGYEMRDWFLRELMPSARSVVWDSARRDVTSVWASGDPEYPKARRGWLALQGARGVAQFQRRGIGLPAATARPVFIGRRNLRLSWDRDLGPVEFSLARTDGGRWRVWDALRDGVEGWSLGTAYLSERDGKVFVVLSHERPARGGSLDPALVCRLTFDTESPATFLTLTATDAVDVISGEGASAWLRRHLAHREAQERRRACWGSPRRPWGHRKGWLAEQDVLSRLTRQRERFHADCNHAWTRRIVSRAVSWGCGMIEYRLPEGELFGHPWAWAEFASFLTYKGAESGAAVVALKD